MSALARRRPVAEGESYFVSMSDLMVGLLFVFMILMMSFALDYREAETISAQRDRELEAQIGAARRAETAARTAETEAFRREAGATAARLEAERRAAELEAINRRLTDNRSSLTHLLDAVERNLRDQGVQVRVFPESGVLRLPESIVFETGSADLSASGRAAVAALGRALGSVVPCFARGGGPLPLPDALLRACPEDRFSQLKAVLIEGHTDDRPVVSGRFNGNWDLSTMRAIETFEALASTWPGLGSVRNPRGEALVGVGGYGEFARSRATPPTPGAALTAASTCVS